MCEQDDSEPRVRSRENKNQLPIVCVCVCLPFLLLGDDVLMVALVLVSRAVKASSCHYCSVSIFGRNFRGFTPFGLEDFQLQAIVRTSSVLQGQVRD